VIRTFLRFHILSAVFTLSLHCEAQSYPSELQQSSLDVPLPAGCTDEEYLEALLNVLPQALAEFKPELVLYNAGTDVHAEDSLGKMAMSTHGILRRDRFVMQSCLMAGVPVAAAIGGGYDAGGNHEKIVDRHMMLHQAASEFAEAMLSTTKLGGKGEQVER
jgi:acetoin utilization deacetylase AcuC-like enzyme